MAHYRVELKKSPTFGHETARQTIKVSRKYCEEYEVGNPLSTPRTKRARIQRVNDENADPNGPNDHAQDNRYEICADLDELEDPFVTSVKRAQWSGTPPAKVSVARGRNTVPSRKSTITTEIEIQCADENKPVQVPTPQTPRHRDALSKKVPITPRRLLSGKSFTARTPRTPTTPSSIPTVYNDARQSFARSADPGRLIGRDAERSELEMFIEGGIDSRLGRCLYVSGPPGTGKSALVREICQDFGSGSDLRKAYVNCMSVKASGDISRILSNDLIGESQQSDLEHTPNLQALMAPKKTIPGPMYLVVLDEMDHLLNLDLEILYDLFEISLQRNSRLILIGIANALDLTDRFLPRLKARNVKPILLPFLPYTAPQIAAVISTKLRVLLPSNGKVPDDYIPFVHPTAILFCSKKVASQTGDLRKAFDIIHRSLALVENEIKQTHQKNIDFPISPSKKSPLSENPNLSSPAKPRTLTASLATISPTTAPRVTIAHVARVTSAALGHGTSQRLGKLNLQQKAALCALISLEKTKRAPRWHSPLDTPSKPSAISSPTVRDWYEIYSSLCKRDNTLHPLTAVEFYDVVGGLETLGLVGEGDKGGFGKISPKKKMGKQEDKRMSSWVSEKELEGCLDGVGGGILMGLLESDT
ncbi:MAG: hypothetical protein Q9218_001151 [Villophora microphyllina]